MVDYWVSPCGHGTGMAVQTPVHMISMSWSINTKRFSIEYQENSGIKSGMHTIMA
jgi:hypothetical protein